MWSMPAASSFLYSMSNSSKRGSQCLFGLWPWWSFDAYETMVPGKFHAISTPFHGLLYAFPLLPVEESQCLCVGMWLPVLATDCFNIRVYKMICIYEIYNKSCIVVHTIRICLLQGFRRYHSLHLFIKW